jgi:hypothetical protein
VRGFRCAGTSGTAGTKAEQNWQATSHGKVAEAITEELARQIGNFPGFDQTNGFVLIQFAIRTAANGIAAKVITYTDLEMPMERPLSRSYRPSGLQRGTIWTG